MTEFSILHGKTVTKIDRDDSEGWYGESLVFHCDDGTAYRMWHEQDCCERVSIEDIVGDLDDLIGSPITLAEEVASDDNDKDPSVGAKDPEWDEAWEWTFYKLSTIKGSVTIRWYGTSNGYYSTGVNFAPLQRAYCDE